MRFYRKAKSVHDMKKCIRVAISLLSRPNYECYTKFPILALPQNWPFDLFRTFVVGGITQNKQGRKTKSEIKKGAKK
jgi:hypothetical protein